MPIEASVRRHPSDVEMSRVVEQRQTSGETAWRGHIPITRARVIERFVGSDAVVFTSKTLETGLLGARRRGRRLRRLGFERAMEPLMAPMLLGVTGFNQFGTDAQSGPP